jgi:hypothetical protein
MPQALLSGVGTALKERFTALAEAASPWSRYSMTCLPGSFELPTLCNSGVNACASTTAQPLRLARVAFLLGLHLSAAGYHRCLAAGAVLAAYCEGDVWAPHNASVRQFGRSEPLPGRCRGCHPASVVAGGRTMLAPARNGQGIAEGAGHVCRALPKELHPQHCG